MKPFFLSAGGRIVPIGWRPGDRGMDQWSYATSAQDIVCRVCSLRLIYSALVSVEVTPALPATHPLPLHTIPPTIPPPPHNKE